MIHQHHHHCQYCTINYYQSKVNHHCVYKRTTLNYKHCNKGATHRSKPANGTVRDTAELIADAVGLVDVLVDVVGGVGDPWLVWVGWLVGVPHTGPTQRSGRCKGYLLQP